jgi:hypothetical protein
MRVVPLDLAVQVRHRRWFATTVPPAPTAIPASASAKEIA